MTNLSGSPNQADVCCRCYTVKSVSVMRIWKPSNVLELSSLQWICKECEALYLKEGITHADDRG